MARKETHIRIGIGRPVLVAIAALALTLVSVAPAMGLEDTLTKRERTKIFYDCPTKNAEVLEIYEEGKEDLVCFTGVTAGGKEGGHFTVGGVTVPLSKKITLHGVAAFAPGTKSEENPTEGNEGKIYPAEDGKTLEAPPLKIPKGAKLITPQIMEEAEWPEALKAIYNEKAEKRELGLSATIEIAGGNQIYEYRNGLNTQALIEASGPAFTLPLKVKISGPLLYKLQKGADTCYVGSDENPVVQHLTSGESVAPFPFEANTQTGAIGELEFNNAFTVVTISGSSLVDSTWPVPTEAEGCGGAYETYVNKALSILLSLPAPAGSSTTALKGTLSSGNFNAVKESKEAHGE